MRFKQRLKVIQSLEDTAKRSVVWTGLGSDGCRLLRGAEGRGHDPSRLLLPTGWVQSP